MEEVSGTASDIRDWIGQHPLEKETQYGHGICFLGQIINNASGLPPEKQKE